MSADSSLLVGIDSGTQSTRVCVFTLDGELSAEASVTTAVDSPRPQWAEQNPAEWCNSAKAALRRALFKLDVSQVAAVGSEGLVTLPHWWGIRFPEDIPHARGATIGWSNRHTSRHLYRSILEGVSFELKRMTMGLEKSFSRSVLSDIRAGGGGTASIVWPKILADILDTPLRVNTQSQATALGAAIMAGTGAGKLLSLHAGCAWRGLWALTCSRGSRFRTPRLTATGSAASATAPSAVFSAGYSVGGPR